MEFKKINDYYFESDQGYRITSIDSNHTKFVASKKIKTNYKNRDAWNFFTDCLSFDEAKRVCSTDHWLNQGNQTDLANDRIKKKTNTQK